MKQIRVQRHCRDRYAHYLPIYEDGDDRVVPCVLDGEAVDEDEDRDGHDGRGEVDWKEARFGFDFAVVTAPVEVAYGVVEPVAYDSAKDGAK